MGRKATIPTPKGMTELRGYVSEKQLNKIVKFNTQRNGEPVGHTIHYIISLMLNLIDQTTLATQVHKSIKLGYQTPAGKFIPFFSDKDNEDIVNASSSLQNKKAS